MYFLGNCFTLTSSVQQDLSEFLLPCQQDLLPSVNTSTNTEYDNVTFNLTLNQTSEENSSNTQPQFQDLTFQNLDCSSENLDTFLVSNNNLRSSTSENETTKNQDNTMHSSLPSMILHSGHVIDYNQTWNGTQAAGSKNAHPEAFAMRKIKVSNAQKSI